MSYMQILGSRAKQASEQVRLLGQEEKNRGLLKVAEQLVIEKEFILKENQKDIIKAREAGVKESLIDRLLLDEQRIEGMAEGLRQIADLDDPIGEVLSMKTRPNGLQIGKKRVPLGVVGVIYESRPNVTVDVFGLCFKTGNVAVLRGGSDAFCSNQVLVQVIRSGLAAVGIVEDAVVFVEDTDRAAATELMRMNEYIDVPLPWRT